jgi:sodium/bile acid cotransporter 7
MRAGGSGEGGGAEGPRRAACSWARARAFVVAQFLPLCFLVAVVIALAWPAPGTAVLSVTVAGGVRLVQELNIIVVFFISGLALNTSDMAKARKHKFEALYGLVMLLLLSPLLGFAVRAVPLESKGLLYGAVIFCIVPTTLGIGIALVRSAKGNDAIALLLTIVSNVLGVFTMPLWLTALLADSGLGHIDIPDLLLKLTITTLVPSLLGKALRDCNRRAEAFAKRYRTELSMFSTANLAFVVWQTLSGARNTLFQQPVGSVLAAAGLVISVHLVLLAINYVVVRKVFKTQLVEAIAVVIMASQKSAPVAVTVVSYVTYDAQLQGILAIPSIIGQLFQIFFGALIAGPIARAVDRDKARAALEAPDAKPAQPDARDHDAASPDSSHDAADTSQVELAPSTSMVQL